MSAQRTTVCDAAPNELACALQSCRAALVGAALISGLINLLYLTGSLFMLQVYDRVIPSRSLPTLVALGFIAVCLYVFQGAFDVLRARILARVGASLDASLAARAFSVSLSARPSLPREATPVRDLDQLRAFASSGGPAAFFDLPWIPVYLLICFAFHPLLGLATVLGGAVLLGVTLFGDRITRPHVLNMTGASVQAQKLLESARRNSEVLRSMGMEGAVSANWQQINTQNSVAQLKIADISAALGGGTRVFRAMLQSAVLALGAYLVIKQEATGGVMIASSILTARALAPLEQVVACWKPFASARLSWQRLGASLAASPVAADKLTLPPPRARFSAEKVTIAPPNASRLVCQNVTFSLERGTILGIIGESGSGKSSLARGLVGAWPLAQGLVMLDGAPLTQWAPEELGRHIGYVPQEVELLRGSIAANISRFRPNPDAAAIILAAKRAGVHEMVMRLPDGYGFQLGEDGAALSGGQRQRVALARALYEEPFILILDEPNSNLDAEGEAALVRAILEFRQRGGIVVVIAHRPALIAAADKLLLLRNGCVDQLGRKDEVLAWLQRGAPKISVEQKARAAQ